MKRNFSKYMESSMFFSIFTALIVLRLDKENGYLIEFSLGKFFYFFLVYFLLKGSIAFVQNKQLKEILRTRLNAFMILSFLVENLIIVLNMKKYGYQEFFLLGIEKFKSGGLFVSLFGKLYDFVPRTAMLSVLGVSIGFLFLYVFGKVIGFMNRVAEKRKSGEYAISKEKRKTEKERLKRAKQEEKIIRKREKALEELEEDTNLNSVEKQEDFLVDIKKEFHTMLQSRTRNEARDANFEEDRRRRIQEDIRERHDLKKNSREIESDEDKTKIVFLKEEKLAGGKLFADKKDEEYSLKNYEQKNLFSYPNEHVELARNLGISLEKLSRAIELIHKTGIKGSGNLAKELRIDSEEAERIYIRVKKLKEYK